MNYKEMFGLLARYFSLILLALGGLFIFYLIFTPLTLFPVAYILKLTYNAYLLPGSTTIFLKGYYAEIVQACVAGAAYYLLLVLNLTTPMHLKKRIYSITFLLGSFLFLNISRIVLFSILLVNGFSYFDLAHQLTWYFGSTILLIVIWFSNIFIFKIKEIPIYSDILKIFEDIFKKKK